MTEREIDNRGTKSRIPTSIFWIKTKIFISILVKAQRVNGSWEGAYKTLSSIRCAPCLRYTLTSFERNCPLVHTRLGQFPGFNPGNFLTWILSNQINKSRRYISTVRIAGGPQGVESLNPWFVTGFADGEANFTLRVTRNKEFKTGWRARVSFQIGVHKKDKDLLKQIKDYLGVGNIYELESESVQFRVESVKDLKIIIDHFNEYPLITQKFSDFLLFKKAYEIILNNKHLTAEGLENLVGIKGSMNLGLLDRSSLSVFFPNVALTPRPLVSNQNIPNPHWVAGFATAEGCFFINLQKSAGHKLKERAKLKFTIAQHSRDESLISSLVEYLDCGVINKGSAAVYYIVTKLSDIHEKIVPFFDKYPIRGAKAKDYADFCRAVEIMKKNGHLTLKGLDQIREIKAGMNRGRGKSSSDEDDS